MLTGNQKHYLRGLAHHRKPAVTIGANGISTEVIAEVERALGDHELVKVKLPTADPSSRKAMVEEVCAATGAHWVQTIGRIGVIYRPAAEPRITIPES
ncbi:MAG: ribosome assembly RNA-binding protein YhbY [Arenicellales bacterium]